MPLGIGKQHEPPKRPSDWEPAMGELNDIPDAAQEQADEMRRRTGQDGGEDKAPDPDTKE